MKCPSLERIRLITILMTAVMLLQAAAAHAIDISRYRFHPMPRTSYYGGIRYIAKDSIGRMWLGDHDAVLMYDGYEFVKMNKVAEQLSLGSLWFYGSIVTGNDGSLYLATNNGMLRFDYGTSKFETALEGNIETLSVDSEGTIWMLRGDKVVSYSPASRSGQASGRSAQASDRTPQASVREYPLPPVSTPRPRNPIVICTDGGTYVAASGVINKLDPATGKYVRSIEVGPIDCPIHDAIEYDGKLCVLTQLEGVFVYDSEGRAIRHYKLPTEYKKSAESKQLYLDAEGVIWVSTQSGLLLIDSQTEESVMLRNDPLDPYSLPGNSIWSIYPDRDGGVWIGTYGGNFAYLTFSDNNVSCYKCMPGGLSYPIVSCFKEDDGGNLWIGTEGGGICYLDRKTNKYTYYSLNNDSGLASNMIKRFDTDSRGNLMVSSFHGGISRFDSRTGKFQAVCRRNPPLSVYDFVQDGDKGIWVSNPDERTMYCTLADGRMEHVYFTDDTGETVEMRVETMFKDMQGNLWLVTHTGIYVTDPSARRIINHVYIEDAPYSMNNLCSYCLASDGSKWFGTRGGGVNRLTLDGKYDNFRDKDGRGLDGLMVFAILEDSRSKDMWFSTDDGLYVYNASAQTISKSQIDIPNLCGAYYLRSAYKTSRGELLFGGTDGFILFDPAKIRYNSQKPEVYFTALLVNNEIVTSQTEDSPIGRDISTGADETIVLSHRESNLEIRFSSDSYLDTERNRYSYRMCGLSDQWSVLPHGQHAVQFFNLPAGTYLFEIKAANCDGLWGDKVTTLKFRIKPSPLLSPFACLLYLILIAGVVIFIWRYFTNKKFYEQKIELERIREENQQALIQARMKFFTNISHDLKTPLTLVVEPLKELNEQLPADSPSRKYIQLIQRNVERIKHTISQLLKFREIESQKITLNKRPGDLIKFLDNIFMLFEFYANKKGIETDFHSQYEDFHTEFDSDVVEKIFTNLLSNAIKYTSEQGYVGVDIRKAGATELPENAAPNPDIEYVCITVTNTGSGIPDDQKDKIFKQFSRIPGSNPQFEESTGLGLAIVKELVDDMEGAISLQSDNSMASFVVVLPFTLNIVSDEEKEESFEYTVSEIDNMIAESEEIPAAEAGSRKAHDLVVVEDDTPLRNYIEQSLSKYYNVYTASNGAEGIGKIEKIVPAVVITDLVMPQMDGFELCRHVRSNIKTSHIPVIALSATGNNDENKVKALECGANVFIDKPVDMDYLLRQTANLIKSRQELKELYSKKYIVEPSKVTISSTDEELLKRAMDCIEKNIGNSEYGVDDFVDDMLIGRTRLYQKIKDLTDMSIKEFIMDIRLKRAEQLLRESDLTIAEISDMTGFSNSKYFSVCFKMRYSQTPSEYKKRL